jgi:hypothetical protein
MTVTASRFAWLRTFLVVLIVAIVPPTLYYLFYASSKGTEAVRRGFRGLDRSAAFAEQQTRIDVNLLITYLAWSPDATAEQIKRRHLKFEHPDLSHQGNGILLDLIDGSEPRLRVQVSDFSKDPRPLAASAPLSEKFKLRFLREDFDAVVVRARNAIASTNAASGATATANVDSATGPADAPPTSNGAKPIDARNERSDVFVVANVDIPDGAVSALETQEVVPCGPEKNSEASTEKPEQKPTSLINLPTIKIAGVEYYTFCRRMDLRSDVQGYEQKPLTLDLIGLRRAKLLRKEALTLSPATFSTLGLLAALVSLSLPYLKVRFMARRERLRRLDMWLLGTTAYLGTAICVLFILYGLTLGVLRDELDARMTKLGVTVASSVAREVSLIRRQMAAGATTLVCDKESQPIQGVLANRELEASIVYPSFTALFCTDRAGNQFGKWVTQSQPTPRAPIADADYFKRAKRLPTIPTRDTSSTTELAGEHATWESDRDFTFDVIDGMEEGVQLAAFATPLDGKRHAIGSTTQERSGFVVLWTRLLALTKPPVPAPYRFIVLGPEKKLLFRSYEFPAQYDISADVEDPKTLNRILEDAGTLPVAMGESLEQISVDDGRWNSPVGEFRYRGRIHRVTALKIPELSATLLLFYDKTDIEGVAAEVLVSAFFWVLLLTAACLVAIGVAWSISPTAWDQLWPAARDKPLYVCGVLTLLAFSIGLSLTIQHLPVRVRGPFVVLAPACALFLLLLVPDWFKRRRAAMTALTGTTTRNNENERTRGDGALWPHTPLYLFFGVFILLALAAVPTALVFLDLERAYHVAFEDLTAAQYESTLRDYFEGGDYKLVSPDDASQNNDALTGGKPISARNLWLVKEQFGSLAAYRSGWWPLPCPQGQHGPTCGSVFSFSLGSLHPQTYFSTVAAALLPSVSTLNPELRASVCTVDAVVPASDETILAFSSVSFWLLAVLLLIGLTLFVRSVARNILGLDFGDDRVFERAGEVSLQGRWLLLRPTTEALGRLRTEFEQHPDTIIDFSDPCYDAEAAPGDTARANPAAHVAKDGAKTGASGATAKQSAEAGGDAILSAKGDGGSAPSVAAHGLDTACAETATSERSQTIAETPGRPIPARGTNAPRPLLIVNVEARLGTRASRAAALKRLRQLIAKDVILVSAIDPLYFLAARAFEATAEERDSLTAELLEWAHVLNVADKVRYGRPDASPDSSAIPDPELRRRLEAECRWTDALRNAQRQLLARPDIAQYSWKHMLEYVGDMAEPYYRTVWGLCSVEEKLTLIQLAEEGLVNPRSFDIVRRLRHRRLVRTTPRFLVINETFRNFVLQAESPAVIKSWETPEEGHGWASVQAPLIALVLVGVGILFYTQQPFFNATTQALGAIAGAMGSVAALLARTRPLEPPRN